MSKNLPAETRQNNLPLNSDDLFAENAGAGLENVTSENILIPRLTILQGLSPQIQKSRSEYIKGAEVGQIADVGLGEIFPDGIEFVPVCFRTEYLEWAPRESGKGLQGIHIDDSILENTTRDDRGRYVLPNGNYIAETAQFYGINMSANRRWCFVPMTSTQLKKARKWNTIAKSERRKRPDGSTYEPPFFYRTYSLSTAGESNNQGSWEGWVIERGPPINEAYPDEYVDIVREAKAMLSMIHSHKIKADMSESEIDSAEEAM